MCWLQSKELSYGWMTNEYLSFPFYIWWNSDMGDGWEHPYDARYPTRYANVAYRLGTNYLLYELTH